MARADELCTYLIGAKSRLLLALSYLEALHPKAIKLIEYYYIVRGRIIPILEDIFPPFFFCWKRSVGGHRCETNWFIQLLNLIFFSYPTCSALALEFLFLLLLVVVSSGVPCRVTGLKGRNWISTTRQVGVLSTSVAAKTLVHHLDLMKAIKCNTVITLLKSVVSFFCLLLLPSWIFSLDEEAIFSS